MLSSRADFAWFSELLAKGAAKDTGDPAPILAWLEASRKESAFQSHLIPLDQVQGWYREPDTGNLFHDSGHFFSIHGVRTVSMGAREVNQWDQPIYNQTEGGVLALVASVDKGMVKFLLNAKAEPGNLGTLQLAPTIQCTWSNLKRAHKGKLPPLAAFALDPEKSRLVYAAQHNEEGGRFWRKSNSNRIYFVDDGTSIDYNPDAFVWATLNQIKNLALIDNVLSPFVKTVVAPL